MSVAILARSPPLGLQHPIKRPSPHDGDRVGSLHHSVCGLGGRDEPIHRRRGFGLLHALSVGGAGVVPRELPSEGGPGPVGALRRAGVVPRALALVSGVGGGV